MTKDCTLPLKKTRGSVLGQRTRGKKITLQKALRKKLDKKKKISEQIDKKRKKRLNKTMVCQKRWLKQVGRK